MHINMLNATGENTIPIGHYTINTKGEVRDLTASLLNTSTEAFHRLDLTRENPDLVEIIVSWVGNSTDSHSQHRPEFIATMQGLGLHPPRSVGTNSHLDQRRGIKNTDVAVAETLIPNVRNGWCFMGAEATQNTRHGHSLARVKHSYLESDLDHFKNLGGWGVLGVKSWLLSYYLKHLFCTTTMWNTSEDYSPRTLAAQNAFSPSLPSPRLAMRCLYDGVEVLIQYTCTELAANQMIEDAGLGSLNCLFLNKLILPYTFVQEYTEGKHDDHMLTYSFPWNRMYQTIHDKWVNNKCSKAFRESKIKAAILLPFKSDQPWKGYVQAIHGTGDNVAAIAGVVRWVRHNRGSAHARPKRQRTIIDSLISLVLGLFERSVLYSALVVSQDPILNCLRIRTSMRQCNPVGDQAKNLRQGVWLLANQRRNKKDWSWLTGYNRAVLSTDTIDSIDYLTSVVLSERCTESPDALEATLTNKLNSLRITEFPALLSPSYGEWKEDIAYYEQCQKDLLCRWKGSTKNYERNLRSFIKKRLEPFLYDRAACYAKVVRPNGFWGVAICYLGVSSKINKEEIQQVCRCLGDLLPSLSMDRLGLCHKSAVLRGGLEVPLSEYNKDIPAALLGYGPSDEYLVWRPPGNNELTWLETWSNMDSVVIWANLLEILEREHKCSRRAKALYVLYASLLVTAASQLPPKETSTNFLCSAANKVRVGEDGQEYLDEGNDNRVYRMCAGNSWGTGTSESSITSLYVHASPNTKRSLLYPEIGKRIETLGAALGEDCPVIHSELLAKIHSGELFSPAPPQTFAQALGLYLIKNKVHY